MAKAIAAIEKAEVAERRMKKVVDPIRRKYSTTIRRKTTSSSTISSTDTSSTNITALAKQPIAFLEAFYAGTPVEFISDQRNIDS